MKKINLSLDDASLEKPIKLLADKLQITLGEDGILVRVAHRTQWLAVNKAFGFEVIDGRYGTLILRCETAAYRLKAYLAGEVEVLEELEEDRLPHGLLYGNCHSSNVSACFKFQMVI